MSVVVGKNDGGFEGWWEEGGLVGKNGGFEGWWEEVKGVLAAVLPKTAPQPSPAPTGPRPSGVVLAEKR